MRNRRRTIMAATGASALALGWVAAPWAGAQAVGEPVALAFTGSDSTYTVPADGSICSVAVDLAGADGGSGDTQPGLGGSISGVIPVSPGDVLVFRIGGVGGPGVDASSAGGFGGGGAGGVNTGDSTLGGGGGGGASWVTVDGTPALVAGGGGGGGAYNGSGGDGAQGPGAGAPGEVITDPNWGTSGDGGTLSAGGAAGTAGTGGEAGLAGASLSGGAGGSSAIGGAGGGGGGGGGYFGGGGGGGAGPGGSGGGGGGGSSYAFVEVTSVAAGTSTPDQAGNGSGTYTPIPGNCPEQPISTTTAPAAAAAAVEPRFTG